MSPALLLMLATQSLQAGDLNGLWLQDCNRGHQRQEFFSGREAIYSEMNFADAACTRPEVELISRGTIELGLPVRAPEDAVQIDFIFTGVAVRLFSERAVQNYNERGVCGISDWKLAQAREVTALDCDFFGIGRAVRVPSHGDQRFGVVKKEIDSLFFGQLSPERDGSRPERRPLDLDPRPYRFIPFR